MCLGQRMVRPAIANKVHIAKSIAGCSSWWLVYKTIILHILTIAHAKRMVPAKAVNLGRIEDLAGFVIRAFKLRKAIGPLGRCS